MPLIVFSPSTTIKSADVNANFAGLANGSFITAIPNNIFTFARQGGSATVYATTGTSNFTSTNIGIQAGSIATSAGGSVTVTFPSSFTQIPIVLAGRSSSGGSAFQMVEVHDITASNFQIDAFNTSAARVADSAQWIAIGPTT